MKSSFKNKTVLSHKRLFLNEKGWIGILKSHYSTHTPYLPKKHWLFNRCPDKLWPNTKMLSFLWTQAQGNDKISTWHLARVCSLPVNTDFFMSYKYKYTCIEMRSTKMWFPIIPHYYISNLCHIRCNYFQTAIQCAWHANKWPKRTRFVNTCNSGWILKGLLVAMW